MMKKILLAAVMLLGTATAFAQHSVGSFTLQPKVGLNIATLTDIDNSKSRVDFAGGLEAEYQATDIFSLSAGLIYSRQGFKMDDTKIAGFTVKGDSWSPSYLNIPVLANVYVVKGLAVKFGVQPGFMVDKDDAGDAVKTFDFSIPVGLSYEFPTVPVVLDARYNWGVTKVIDAGDDSPKNSVFQITLGYKFDL
jgi:hypothetical protein